MLVVRIELHSALTGRVTEIARGIIANDGSSDAKDTGNYDVSLLKSAAYAKEANVGKPWKQGKVTDFPRLRLGPWDLLLRALAAVISGRNVYYMREIGVDPTLDRVEEIMERRAMAEIEALDGNP